MPYKSEKQRRLMHAKHPEIAARWDAELHPRKGSVRKNEEPQVKKSAWGVVHKGSPDQSALHIPSVTMTTPKRLRRVKRKRTTEI